LKAFSIFPHIVSALGGSAGNLTAVDILLAVGGHRTYTVKVWSVYMEIEVSAGQTITLTLWRSGVTTSVDVTTTERPPTRDKFAKIRTIVNFINSFL
jgi:S1-C subfamily serine protease